MGVIRGRVGVHTVRRSAVVLLALAAATAGCGSNAGSTPAGSTPPSPSATGGTHVGLVLTPTAQVGPSDPRLAASAALIRQRLHALGAGDAVVAVHNGDIEITGASAEEALLTQVSKPAVVNFRVVILCAATHGASVSGAANAAYRCVAPLQQDSGAPPSYAANLVNANAPSGQNLTVPPSVYQQFLSTNCSDPATLQAPDPNPAGDQAVVSCDQSGGTKYLLAPAAVHGVNVTGASAQVQMDVQGKATGQWEVVLSLNSAGSNAFSSVTNTLSTSQNQLAITLDNQVVSAPTVAQAIPNGQAAVSGATINASSARTLAGILQYGALPLAFHVTAADPSRAGAVPSS